MTTVYRLIARDNNTVTQYRDPNNITNFLLGRRLGAYIIIKSDDLGDRVIPMPTGEVGRGIDWERVNVLLRTS